MVPVCIHDRTIVTKNYGVFAVSLQAQALEEKNLNTTFPFELLTNFLLAKGHSLYVSVNDFTARSSETTALTLHPLGK